MVKIAQDLQANGTRVRKVALNLTDKLYEYNGIECVKFDAPYEEFAGWLEEYVTQNNIDTLILYNEARPYNEIGWALAQKLGISCLVFELGLLRPNYCSVYSSHFHHATHLKELWQQREQIEFEPLPKTTVFCRPDSRVKLAKMCGLLLLNRLYTSLTRNYCHQVDKRCQKISTHLKPASKQILRFYARNNDAQYNALFKGEWSKKYYLCPLQVHYDAQITERSDYDSIEDFIIEVADSFYTNAPQDTKLIFKVHPMNRGYVDYAELIESLNTKHGDDRIIYLDRIHLPTTLINARGCVTVNSTVGISALEHLCPTITLGQAVFDLEGLTYQGSLDHFWQTEQPVQKKSVAKFLRLLQETTQAQGVLYQKTLRCTGHSKVQWPPLFKHLFHDIES